MTEIRAHRDAGLIEDDDDPDRDPVTVRMTRRDAGRLAVLLEFAWEAGVPMEPPDIPVYAALRTAAGDPVPYAELGRLAVEALGGPQDDRGGK